MIVKLFVVIFAVLSVSECAKILVVHPSFSKSHVILGKALYTELAKSDHNVTVISNFPLEKPLKNYRDIYIPLTQEIQDLLKFTMAEENQKFPYVQIFKAFGKLTTLMMTSVINNREVIKLMNNESFDLVILGYMTNEALLGLAAHFKCPQIIFFANSYFGFVNYVVGNPESSSYVPNFWISDKKEMNFIERLQNVFINALTNVAFKYVDYLNNEWYKEIFSEEKYPSLEEVKKNISLVFVNTHFSQGVLRPNQPNIIEIGGIAAKETPDKLPNDIQDWLDSAEYGAIFMSFGTNFKSSDFSSDKLVAVLSTFGKLKQKVLWKWDDELVTGKPGNVKISKWLPQDDILGHPNVKLFITHGGLGSLTESKCHGVPVLSMPIFGDQAKNVRVVVEEGWAVHVDYDNFTEKAFSDGINDAINNPKYSERVKSLSLLFKDRPLPALKTAVYWTEYVIRHKGAKHLQSNAVHLNFFQLHLLDVWAFLLIAALIVIKIQIIGIKFVIRKICLKSNKKSKKE